MKPSTMAPDPQNEQMREQLEKLKKHGIDLEDGTLSIRLWE